MNERGVLRCYRDPGGRRPTVLARVVRAALELGLPPPVSPERPHAPPELTLGVGGAKFR